MTRIRMTSILLVLALASSVPTLVTPSGAENAPGAADLPSVDELLQAYVVATGGAEAWTSIHSYRTQGTFDVPAMGISGTILVMGDDAANSRTEIDIPGVGKQQQGVSGDVVWELSVMSGPRVLGEEEAAMTKRRSDAIWFLDWKRHYTEGSCVGTEEVEGEACYRVEFETPEGLPETHFFSVESGLETQVAMTVRHQMGDIPATMTIRKYEDFGGVKIPTEMAQNAAGMEQVIRISRFETNPDLGEDAFAVPAEVAALLEPAGK